MHSIVYGFLWGLGFLGSVWAMIVIWLLMEELYDLINKN